MFRRLFTLLLHSREIESLAASVEHQARRLNGVSSLDEGADDPVAMLESTKLLLDRYKRRSASARETEQPHQDIAGLARSIKREAKRLKGLPPGDEEKGDPVALLDSARQLLSSIEGRAETVPAPPAEAPSLIKEQAAPAPPKIAQELVILRDWVLLANQGQGAADPQAMTSTLEGLYKRLGQLLQQEGLHTLDVTGEPFDGDRQQVMDTRATNDPALDDTVCSTLRPGYLFQARLYRPQQVILYQYKDQGVS